MKKLLVSVICLMAAIASNAQSNLQFDEVLLIDNTGSTVPTGKLWKVESVLSTSDLAASGGTDTQQKTTRIVVNSIQIILSQCSSWAGAGSGSNANPRPYGYTCHDVTKLPLWLPSGTSLAAGTNVDRISVLEFTLVP
jgi:hypothetical protein